MDSVKEEEASSLACVMFTRLAKSLRNAEICWRILSLAGLAEEDVTEVEEAEEVEGEEEGEATELEGREEGGGEEESVST